MRNKWNLVRANRWAAMVLVCMSAAAVGCGEDTTVEAIAGVDASVSADTQTGGVGGADSTATDPDGATTTADGAATDPDAQASGDGGTTGIDGGTGGDSGATDSDGGSIGSDGGTTGSDSGATDSDGGTTGSDGGTTGSDGGTTGSDGGTTGSDGGTTGGDSGATGGDGGTTGGDSGATDNDGGTTGGDSGSTDSDGGATGSDSGSTAGDGGTTGGDGGGTATDGGTTTACKADADCGKASACATLTCTNGACVTGSAADGSACDDGNLCTDKDTCKTGACAAGAAKVCDDKNLCTDDSCDSKTGSCANAVTTAACDDGNACTAGEACKAGKCEGGVAKDCDDKNACTADACDPAKGGCLNSAQAGKCDDSSACTSDDLCDNGKCGGKANVLCDDGNTCTVDTCNAADGTCAFKVSLSAPCNDGNICTDKDACANNGKCVGSAKVCDDSNPCTDDACDAKAGCTNKANAAGCDDGNFCTDKDACKDGKCTAGAAKVCDDSNPCTDDSCDGKVAGGCVFANNVAPCSAGDLCQAAACKDAKCQPTSGPKNCNDKNECTTDSCDPKTGCVNVAVADGGACGASVDACVKAAACKTGKCEPGANLSCDDGNACTNNTCDPKAGCAFAPNTIPCDDGNACTVGDKCGVVAGQGAKCTAGSSLDLKTCDDSNGCTNDSCDPKIGCAHTPNTAACDDGDKCTTGDVCAATKCAGKAGKACDDGNQCTTDKCDSASGACSWGGITGACDDGSDCSSGDACTNGKCVGLAKVCDDKSPCTTDSCDAKTGNCATTAGNDGAQCDDGSLCTSVDACAAGKCAGKDANCEDANACTDDSCDAKTGKCANANTTAPCDDGDKCTTSDACAAGACKAGAAAVCDDKNTCTSDSCDKIKGCVYAAVADGTACDDGVACTTASACKTGSCLPTVNCVFINEPFACTTPTTWQIVVPPSPQSVPRKVVWKVDQAPAVGTAEQQAAHGCTMNFNNDTNYCDGGSVGGNNYCLVPAGTTRSPDIDWTTYKSGSGELLFDIYYDVDTPNDPNEIPQIVVKNSNGGGVMATFLLPKQPADLKVWKAAVKHNITAALGHKFYLEASMAIFGNPQYTNGNTGTGIFLDNVKVSLIFVGVAEICTDNIDNNGDGKIDCLDPTCVSVYPCTAVKLIDDPILCSDTDWLFAGTDAATTNKVAWAVDNTPAVTPFSGTCSLNYNNGTNYDAKSVVNGTSSVANAGTATWSKLLDATGMTKLSVSLKFYYDTENGSNSQGYDMMWVQMSTNDFAGCCNVATGGQCTISVPNDCNTTNTRSFVLPRTNGVKIWHGFAQDVAQWFAGKAGIKFRIRFNTVDEKGNNFAGPRIDDVLVVGAK